MTKKRILCVEDHPEMIELVKLILGRRGYQVEGAVGGQEGLDAMVQDPPDLILLDLSMPALSGDNVARFIRRYERQPIPIVLYSSRSAAELEEAMLDMRAEGFVQKGETDEQFLAVISSALRSDHRMSR